MNSETLSLKTIINKFYLLKKKEKVTIQWNVWKKKRFVVACNQANRKKADPSDAKDYYNSYLKKKKYKIGKMIKSNH